MKRLALTLALLAALGVGVYQATAQAARHYYLTDWIGTGTDTDPFRPGGTVRGTPGWAALDFRANRTVATGFAILSLPARNDDTARRTYLGTDLDATQVTGKSAIQAQLGVTVQATTLRGIIAELFLVHGRTDGTRWPPLRSRHGVEIHLGTRIYGGEPRVWLRPLGSLWALLTPRAAWADYFTEAWTCADNAALTCALTWDEFSGTDWQIVSNRARLTGNVGSDRARAQHDTVSDDQRVSATLSTWTFSSNELGVNLGCRKDSTATFTAYRWGPFQDNSPLDNSHYLEEVTAGTAATLANPADDVAAGSVLMITCVDSVIAGYINGVQITSVTDTSITGNTRSFIGATSSNAGNTVEVDNFRVEDYFHYTYRERGLGRGLGRGMQR